MKLRQLKEAGFEVKFPEPRGFQVIAFGLNAVDTICVLSDWPQHGGKMRIQKRFYLGGGQVATAAALCGRYGLRTRYVGRVGDDPTGQFSLQDLQKEPLELSFLEVMPGAFSQFAIILVDLPTGERTVLWDRDSRLLYKPGDLKQEAFVDGQLLHLDGHDVPASIRAASWAREAGLVVTLDIDEVQPGAEDLLALADFAIPSQDFASRFGGPDGWQRGLMVLDEMTPGRVLATLGADGVALVWEGEIVQVPAFPVSAVDTTGAGDVFHGAFAYALFQDWSIWDCLRFCNAAAALSCTRYGARAGIPSRAEVVQFLGAT